MRNLSQFETPLVSPKPGKIFLIGAGPGDPELITVKGLRRLQQADVVLYDRLVAPELLHESRTTAERIYVGKKPNSTDNCSQAQINRLLVDHARLGKMVVRLKGGDPFIFGRGSEEALAYVAARIPFEIVPGISSVNAVPAYAGIPLTHRNLSTSLVITSHKSPDKPASSINYAALAQQNGTLVILMGVNTLNRTIQALINAGLSPEITAACIEHGTTNQQRIVTASVADFPHQVKQGQISPPARPWSLSVALCKCIPV